MNFRKSSVSNSYEKICLEFKTPQRHGLNKKRIFIYLKENLQRETACVDLLLSW